MATITIVDESTLGEKRCWGLDMLDETMTLREIIRRRIYQEVADYNARQTDHFYGLVQPTNAERALNGYRMKTPHRLDWEAQYEKAIEAFGRRGFIVLVDDRQTQTLDDQIELRGGAEVTFLKLVPLVGG